MTLELDRQEAAPAPAGTTRRRRRGARSGISLGSISGLTLGIATLWLTILVLLPLAAVVGKAFGSGWTDFWSAITDREAKDALLLTVALSLAVAVVGALMGTLVAWVLVREPFPGSRVLESVIDIPFALPTVVAGIVMLAVYGNDGIGPNLSGGSGDTAARVGMLITLLFVTLPFTVRTVQPVLLELDRDVEQAAASLGASAPVVFRRIVLPQIVPAVASGSTLAFARALGEYGSLVFISSALPFKTEVASVLIYGKLQNSDSPERATQQAASISAVLLVASAVVLVLLDVIQRRVARRG